MSSYFDAIGTRIGACQEPAAAIRSGPSLPGAETKRSFHEDWI